MTEVSEYVRQVEAYLCQKNQGHLIRVVGPAFELVCGWAASGVPIKVAMRGIDRCCERHEGKGPRRRPVRIEFCEADVLDAFDEWRRAVGLTAADAAGAEELPSRKPALAAHIERAIARLANVRGVDAAATEFHLTIDATVRELEQMLATAPRIRGDARAAVVVRLAELDAALMECATRQLTAEEAERLRHEAVQELSAFAARMPAEARSRAADGAFRRLLREGARLPTLAYD